MEMNPSLFEGRLVRLTSVDPDKDAEIERKWTHDLEYLHMFADQIAMPLSIFQIKKRYEKLEKEMEESGRQFHFAVRAKAAAGHESPDRLVGFVNLSWIEWSHGSGRLSLGIGSPQDRRRGYGTEALQLIMRYAFHELNLFRVEVAVPEYNRIALPFFAKSGFAEEVRQREALHRYGRRWDLVYMGLLSDEWEETRKTRDVNREA